MASKHPTVRRLSSGSLLALVLMRGLACARTEPLPHSGFVDEPVAVVATQTSGQVASVRVREGDRVHQGELLAQIESSARQAAVEVARANVVRARQALKEARANLRAATPAVRGAGADIERAQATLDEAQRNYDRTESLVRSEAETQAALDAARARLLEARAAVESMRAAKAQSQGRVSVSFAAVDNAEAAVHGAEAELALAQAELEQTRVLCPFDGLVVSRNLQPGEWAAPGTPIVTIEDTAHPWVRLDVQETDFRGLHIGRSASIRVLALGDRWLPGRVVQVGAEGDFALDRDVKRGRPDVRTFLVRVAFDRPPVDLRPGMTAEVRLEARREPAPPASSSVSAEARP